MCRAPSLDTISRTYRNIDIAISQQSHDVAKLTSRMTELNLNTPSLVTVTRDKRLPDIVSRRPFNITPNVAVTTAAALNAERSAQKLKRALLAARKQPHLNTKAAQAPAPSIAFTPPRSMLPSGLGGPSPIGIGAQRPMFDDSDLLFDDLSASPSPSPLPTRRTRTGVKHHNKPIALTRTSANRGSPAATNFDWGPLPTVTPMTTISADVRRRDSPGGS
jgi:nucleoporin NUP159